MIVLGFWVPSSFLPRGEVEDIQLRSVTIEMFVKLEMLLNTVAKAVGLRGNLGIQRTVL